MKTLELKENEMMIVIDNKKIIIELIAPKSSKVFDLFLYTTISGWMYMLDNNCFLPGDMVTDGELVYKISENFEIFSYIYSKLGLPGYGGDSCWVYSFDKQIPNCEGKVLKFISNFEQL